MSKPKATQPPAPDTARHPCATPGCSALIAQGCIVCVAHAVSPQRRLGPCPTCGATVLATQWALDAVGDWQPQGALESPILGDPHDCAVAVIQNASHWQYGMRLAMPGRFPSREGGIYGCYEKTENGPKEVK
jgi:hypothetical protein